MGADTAKTVHTANRATLDLRMLFDDRAVRFNTVPSTLVPNQRHNDTVVVGKLEDNLKMFLRTAAIVGRSDELISRVPALSTPLSRQHSGTAHGAGLLSDPLVAIASMLVLGIHHASSLTS